MKKDQAQKRRLMTDSDHELLGVKEVINDILRETNSLPPDVKQALIQARNAAWKAFVKDQERVNDTILKEYKTIESNQE